MPNWLRYSNVVDVSYRKNRSNWHQYRSIGTSLGPQCFLQLMYRVHMNWEPVNIQCSGCTEAQIFCNCSFILSRGYKKKKKPSYKGEKGNAVTGPKGTKVFQLEVSEDRSIYREWRKCNYCRLFRDSTNLHRETQTNALILSKHKTVLL